MANRLDDFGPVALRNVWEQELDNAFSFMKSVEKRAVTYQHVGF